MKGTEQGLAAAFDNRLPSSLGQSFLQQPMRWPPQDAPKLPPGARGQKYPCFAKATQGHVKYFLIENPSYHASMKESRNF